MLKTIGTFLLGLVVGGIIGWGSTYGSLSALEQKLTQAVAASGELGKLKTKLEDQVKQLTGAKDAAEGALKASKDDAAKLDAQLKQAAAAKDAAEAALKQAQGAKVAAEAALNTAREQASAALAAKEAAEKALAAQPKPQ